MTRSQKKSHLSMHFFSSHIESRVCALRIQRCDDEYVFEWKDKLTKTRHASTSFHPIPSHPATTSTRMSPSRASPRGAVTVSMPAMSSSRT